MTIIGTSKLQFPLASVGTSVPPDPAQNYVDVHLQKSFTAEDLGIAPYAADSSEITPIESQTAMDLDRGARTLGLLNSGQPQLTVTLRDNEADQIGPYASGNQVGVPTTNNIAADAAQDGSGRKVVATGQLFAYDVALHELGHVVQSQAMDAAGFTKLDLVTREAFNDGHVASPAMLAASGITTQNAAEASALREGLSDSTAAVITHDWVLGEGYFGPGSQITSVRNIADPTDHGTMEPIEDDYKYARAGLDGTGPSSRVENGVTIYDNEGHSLGGIVSRSVYSFEKQQGWDQATQLVTTLQRDPEMWREGGTLEAFRDRFLAVANEMEKDGDTGALVAAQTALRSVDFTIPAGDKGTPIAPPAVTLPVDPGPESPAPKGSVPPPPVTTSHSKLGVVSLYGGVGAVAGLVVGAALAKLVPFRLGTGLAVGGVVGATLGVVTGERMAS